MLQSRTFVITPLTTSSLLFGYPPHGKLCFGGVPVYFFARDGPYSWPGVTPSRGKTVAAPVCRFAYGLNWAVIHSLRIEIRLLSPSRVPLCASGATSARPTGA